MMVNDNRQKIERLIQETKDPGLQATLMVLLRLDTSLDSNTSATQAIAAAFDLHRKEFSTFKTDVHKFVANGDKVIASVRSGWWVASIMGVVIIGLGLYIWQAQMAAHSDEVKGQRTLEARVTALEVQMRAIEKRHEREGNGK